MQLKILACIEPGEYCETVPQFAFDHGGTI